MVDESNWSTSQMLCLGPIAQTKSSVENPYSVMSMSLCTLRSAVSVFHGHVTDVNSGERTACTTQPSIVLF